MPQSIYKLCHIMALQRRRLKMWEKLKTASTRFLFPAPFLFGLCCMWQAIRSVASGKHQSFWSRQIEQSKCGSDNWRAFSAANFATELSATLPLHCGRSCFCRSSAGKPEGESVEKEDPNVGQDWGAPGKT